MTKHRALQHPVITKTSTTIATVCAVKSSGAAGGGAIGPGGVSQPGGGVIDAGGGGGSGRGRMHSQPVQSQPNCCSSNRHSVSGSSWGARSAHSLHVLFCCKHTAHDIRKGSPGRLDRFNGAG